MLNKIMANKKHCFSLTLLIIYLFIKIKIMITHDTPPFDVGNWDLIIYSECLQIAARGCINEIKGKVLQAVISICRRTTWSNNNLLISMHVPKNEKGKRRSMFVAIIINKIHKKPWLDRVSYDPAYIIIAHQILATHHEDWKCFFGTTL